MWNVTESAWETEGTGSAMVTTYGITTHGASTDSPTTVSGVSSLLSLFSVTSFSGDITESDDMSPTWFTVTEGSRWS